MTRGRWFVAVVLAMGVAAQVMAWQQRLGGLPAPMQSATKATIGVPLLSTELGPDARCGVLIGFGADPSADPSGWLMTDVSGDVDQNAIIRIVPGRGNEQSLSQPARAELVLLNPLGDYTPRRIQSRYWPGVHLGIPIAVIVTTGGSGEIDRFTGFIDGLYPGWDTTGSYAIVRVTAKGVLSRIGQGSAPLRSPLYRAHTATGTLVAYWPLEDGSTATSGANAVTGGPAMIASGTVTFAAVTDLAGSVQAPDISAGFLRGLVSGGSSSAWHVEFDLKANYTSIGVARVYAVGGDGTHAVWRFFVPQVAGDLVQVIVGPSDGTITIGLSGTPASWTANAWHHYAITAQQSGSNVASALWVDGTLLASGTAAGTLAGVSQVLLNQNTDSNVASAAHVAVGNTTTLSTAGDAFDGYTGEGCWTRFLRLCREEGIPAAISNGATSGGKAMGPQGTDTLINLLRECEAVDGGVMADG